MPTQIKTQASVHTAPSASTRSQEVPQAAMPPPFSPTPPQINAHTSSPSPTEAADCRARSQEPVQGANAHPSSSTDAHMTGPYSSMPAQMTAQAPVPTHSTSAASTGSQELPQAAMTPPFGSMPAEMNTQAPDPTAAADWMARSQGRYKVPSHSPVAPQPPR